MESFNLIIAFLILMLVLFFDQHFFEILYNNKWGRAGIIFLLILISIASIWLSFIFLLFIIYFSQHTKKVFHIKETFVNKPKKYKRCKGCKKQNNASGVMASEKMRPKSSKNLAVTSNKPPKDVSPYTTNYYYNL